MEKLSQINKTTLMDTVNTLPVLKMNKNTLHCTVIVKGVLLLKLPSILIYNEYVIYILQMNKIRGIE